jgi:putative endonuclease
MRDFYVYIVTNARRTVFYTGMTNNLTRRINEHRAGKGSQFSAKYKTKQVMLAERFTHARDAIKREKQIKGWGRVKKLALIRMSNPDLVDLYHSAPEVPERDPSTGSG